MQLAERPRPRRRRRRWFPLGALGLAMGGVLFTSCLGAAALGTCAGRSSSAPVAMAPAAIALPSSPPPKKDLHASWYPQTGVLPAVVDVDGDGTKDLVGLFWRVGQDEAPLHAAAIDGNTFDVKWTAGPYPAQWQGTRTHLAVVGTKVLVTDSQDHARVLMLSTGEVVLSELIEGGLTVACAMDGDDGHALVQLGRDPKGLRIFDMDSGATWVSDAGKLASCNDHRPRLADGDLRIEAGTTLVARDKKRELWRGPVAAEGDVMHYGAAQHDLEDGTLVSLYQIKSGPFRLVARDARTGRETWRALVPRTSHGSYVSAFGVEDPFVLVVVNQTLHVFDARTGVHVRAIDATTT